MSNGGKIRVALVGLGFGAEFIPIYQRHPNAEMYAICRRDRKELDACGDRFGISVRYTDYNALLADPNVCRQREERTAPVDRVEVLSCRKTGERTVRGLTARHVPSELPEDLTRRGPTGFRWRPRGCLCRRD